jgi:hypothetical protein
MGWVLMTAKNGRVFMFSAVLLLTLIFVALESVCAAAASDTGETVTATYSKYTYTFNTMTTNALTVYSFSGRVWGGKSTSGYDVTFDQSALPSSFLSVANSALFSFTPQYDYPAGGEPLDMAIDMNMQYFDQNSRSIDNLSTSVGIQGNPVYFKIWFFDANKKFIGFIQSNDKIDFQPDENNQHVNPYTAFTLYQVLDIKPNAEIVPSLSPSPSFPVTPSAQPVPSAITEGPTAPQTPASSAETAKTGNRMMPVAVAGMTAAAVVVLAVGGGGIFLAVNAAEVAEVVKLAATATSTHSAASSGASGAGKLRYPFVYFKLRKYSFVLGLKDGDGIGKLLQKVRLPLKSGEKAVMDITNTMKDDTYSDYKIRHPKKAMNGKKDVTIAYMNSETIIGQDHFDSKDDFVNVKYLDREAVSGARPAEEGQ